MHYSVDPFRFDKPILGTPELCIGQESGILTGRPSGIGQFVIGVCIEESRNGVLLSRIRRDFQFNVVPCEKAIAAKIFVDEVITDAARIINVINSCGDSIVDFSSSSEGTALNNYNWNISSPDGSLFYEDTGADLMDFSLAFPEIGMYEGFLVVNDDDQCRDTAFFNVRLLPGVESLFMIENG